MSEKKYLDLSGLSNFLDNIRSLFANKTHTHKISDITDFSDNDTTYTLSKSGATITLIGSDGNNTSVTETTYSNATQSASGLMSKSDKTKLDGIVEGAEVNQNAFSNVIVGSTTIAADGKTDSLTFTAGDNITLTPNATDDSITIDAKDTTYSNATTSVAGLMSTDDKKKLDGIAASANNYILPVAGSAIGGVKSGTDITVDSSGNVSVNNDSHTHGATTITSVDASVIQGTISEANLPSYVDDVVEYSAKSNFPATGVSGKIYVDTATNLPYRWSGSTYVEISSSIALGETSSTAYRGDRGAAAYAHAVTNKGSAFSSGLYKITTNSEGHVTAAILVTKSDITALGIPASDTDTKVTQTVTTSNAVYPLLLAPSEQTATTTTTSYFDSGVTLNPSTNTIAANITGNAGGNAATASKLKTAITINGTSFDGSSAITTANWGTARNIYIADSDGTNTSSSVSVDGSGNVTLKLPSTIKATLSGNASTATKAGYATQANSLAAVTTEGSGSAYTATVDGITALAAGVNFVMIPHTVSTTTSPTLDVNGLGAKTIRQPLTNSTSSTTSAANSNWLGSGKPVRVTYNGTFWVADLVRPNAVTLYGTTAVTNGGTGKSTVASGSYLVGNGTGALVEKTPAQLYADIQSYVQEEIESYIGTALSGSY